MLAEALQAEVDAYIAAFTAERDANGRRLVVCNGYHEPREVLTSAGADAAYGAKFRKATAKITDDLDQLLAFYDYPAEHWVHLRTTNPIVIWSPRGAVLHVDHEGVRGRARGPRGWRWRSSSSSQRKTAGAPSTHRISSPWSAPSRPSLTANSSSDPARRVRKTLPKRS